MVALTPVPVCITAYGGDVIKTPTALDLLWRPRRGQKSISTLSGKARHGAQRLAAYAFDIDKLNAFTTFYNDLMLGNSELSKLSEMIAVVVSSINRCFYCLTAHGAAVRELSGDLGEQLVMNYKAADLPPERRAMLDFAALLTTASATVPRAGSSNIGTMASMTVTLDITSVAAFFNMTNRVASGTAMVPNEEYHSQAR